MANKVVEPVGQLMISASELPTNTHNVVNPGPSSNLSRGMLASVRRRFFLCFTLGVFLCFLLGASAYICLPPKYTATAFLRVSSKRLHLLDRDAAAQRSDFNIYQATQKQFMTTPFVLTAALRTEGVSELELIKKRGTTAVDWLGKNISAKFPSDAEIMHVSLAGTSNPSELAIIVNAVVEAYLKEVVQNERQSQDNRLKSLYEAYDQTNFELRKKRADVKELAERLGSGDNEALSVKQQNALNNIALLRSQLTNIKFDLLRTKGELMILAESQTNLDDRLTEENAGESPIPNEKLDPLLKSDTVTVSLIDAIRQQEQQLEDLNKKLHVKAAERLAKQIQADISRLQSELKVRRDDLIQNSLQTSTVTIKNKMSELANNVRVYEYQQELLEKDLARAESENILMGTDSVELELQRMELESTSDVLRRLGEEIEHTKLESTPNDRVSFFGPATRPSRKNQHQQIAVSLLAGLFGLGLGVGLIGWWDVRKKHVDSSDEISRELSWEVLGTLPLLPRRVLQNSRPQSRKDRLWRATYNDAVAGAVSMLVRKAKTDDQHVVLVSSAQPGEGKSTLAGQLAIGLAETGNSTVLVDFDLRRPTLHKALGLSLSPGVTNVICGDAEIQTLIQPTSHESLSFISAGEWGHSPLNHLSGSRVGDIFGQLRSKYDFVIVDGSPVLTVVDTRLIAQHVDGVVLSILRDVSRMSKLLAAKDVLSSYKVPFLGAVVTGASKTEAYGNGAIRYYQEARVDTVV